ncbi:MAG: EAL domain-containing protein [Sulfuricella sp.]|nr:EAL domain-containing protein [Sulfuricella sp.]
MTANQRKRALAPSGPRKTKVEPPTLCDPQATIAPELCAYPDQVRRSRETEEALHQVVDAFNAFRDPIFIHDSEFRILRANPAYLACARQPLRNILGKPYWQVFPKGDGPLASCLKALQRGSMMEEAENVATESNEVFHSRAFAVQADNGDYLYSVHLLEDITERIRMEEALRQEKMLSEATIGSAPGFFFVVDREGRHVRWNGYLNKMTGLSDEKLRETALLQIVHEGDKLFAAAKMQEAFGGGYAQGEMRLVTVDKGVRDFSISARRFAVDDATYLAGFGVDVTEQKRAVAQLQLDAQVFNGATESILIMDAEKRVIQVNPAFIAITGYTPQETIGKKRWLLLARVHDKATYRAIWKALRRHDHWRGEIHGQRKNGEVYPMLLNISRVHNAQGEISNYIAIFSDITDLKRSHEQMEHMATHDRLTGLPNRNLFYDRLQHSLDKVARHDEHLAVMFVDLDNFKAINDTLGHEMGDLLLRQVAERLQACTRKQDTIARLGGDEFTILTESLKTAFEDVISTTAQRIVASLAAPFDLGGREVHISASVGIALYPKDGKNLSALLKRADMAMYNAKEIGKNNYQFFTEEMNIRAAERMAFESDLRGALKGGEFFLEYQPQMQLGSSRIVAVEALLRWQSPKRGLVLPERFIPVAEVMGLIVPIGEWVLQSVCRQIREWTSQGLRDIRVAINLSSRQFRQDGLAEAIRRAMEKNRIPAANLEFELSESAVMDDAESAAKILQQLKDMGVRLAIDDFVIGYSSLQHLKRFPIDNLKLDSHFTQGVATDAGDQVIAAAIIAMGHSMKLDVIAKGVETQQQLEFFQNNGCDLAQGFFINRPLSPEHVATMIGHA